MKILHVEDSREDAELVRALLTEEWPDCKIEVVPTKAAFLESLKGPADYDIVLSDFSLGAFTGMDALAIVRERLPATPFIFLSGTIGEDRAIEALQAGAQDYVLKDRMKRLISAIRRARRESEELGKQRRAAEQTTARFAMLSSRARPTSSACARWRGASSTSTARGSRWRPWATTTTSACSG